MPIRPEYRTVERWARGWWGTQEQSFSSSSLPPTLRKFRAWVNRQPKAARGRLVWLAREHLWSYYFGSPKARERSARRSRETPDQEPVDRVRRLGQRRTNWAGRSVLQATFKTSLIRLGNMATTDAHVAAEIGLEALGEKLGTFPERLPGGRKPKVPPEAIAFRDDLAKRLRKAKRMGSVDFETVLGRTPNPEERIALRRMIEDNRTSPSALADQITAKTWALLESTVRRS